MPKYSMSNEMGDRLARSFTYHAPKTDQAERYVELRDKAKELAELIVACTPPSREQSLALSELEGSIMWANKAISCNE